MILFTTFFIKISLKQFKKEKYPFIFNELLDEYVDFLHK